jgi:glyoxylate reductase
VKVCVTHDIPGPAIEVLQGKGFEVSLSIRDRSLERAELLEFVKGADAIISLLSDKIDAAVLDVAGPQLKIVANYAIGFDNVDLEAAKSRGVVVTNTPSQTITDAVAEQTFTLMMALAKKLRASDEFTRDGNYHGWDPNLFIGTQLLGKTLGIIGLGRIGGVVARMAVKGMGMRVVYNSSSRKEDFEKEFGARFTNLDDLLSLSDFVTLHVPLTPETRHLIDSRRLELMKRSAFIINTARGAIIAEADLVKALQEGMIAGAGLDVFENENSVSAALRLADNVILTPHVASATSEAREEMSRIAAENVIAVLSGKNPPNPAFISA